MIQHKIYDLIIYVCKSVYTACTRLCDTIRHVMASSDHDQTSTFELF